MIRDRVALDLPEYLLILTGHYKKDAKYRSWRENGTDDWLLIATLAGSGRFGAGITQIITQPHDIVLIRPGETHDYGTAPGAAGWELLWAHFHPRPHWYEWLAWIEVGKNNAPNSPAYEGIVERPAEFMHLRPSKQAWNAIQTQLWKSHSLSTGSDTSYSRELAMTALEEVILHCHGEILRTRRSVDGRVLSVLQYIRERMAEDITLYRLADHAQLSPSRLSHLFQAHIGIAPMQYLDLQRIERSKLLLKHTTNGIKAIAEEIGLEPTYFSLRFKQHTGMSPRLYRNSSR